MNDACPLPDLRTIGQVIDKAMLEMDSGALAWSATGAGAGVTVARNRKALNMLALIPSLGKDVSRVDTSTSILGVDLAIPVFLAPIGALGIYDELDALGAARSAVTASTSIVSAMLTRSLWSEVADTAIGQHFFQLYACGDKLWLSDILSEVCDIGYSGICLTMDSAVVARRDKVSKLATSGIQRRMRRRTWLAGAGTRSSERATRGQTWSGSAQSQSYR